MTSSSGSPNLVAGALAARSLELIAAAQAAGGGIIASPTFPVYRYCWFRDGAYTAYALDLWHQHDRADRFYEWAMDAVGRRAAAAGRAMTAARLGHAPAEADLLHTRYRVDGAAADDQWPNFQLDGFGTLLWGLHEHLRLTGQPLPPSWRPAVSLLADYLGALWRFPCFDCWEEFGDHIHTSTLAALYGGLTAAASLLNDAAPAEQAAAIRAFVLEHCVHNGSLVKFVGNPAVDGSLVHVATPYRLLRLDDPVVAKTTARIDVELRQEGGGVHRYRADSYYGGGEWLLITAYLGWHYVETGRLDAAADLLAWVEAQAGPDGALPEQVAEHLNQPEMLPVWIAHWGPSANPLIWSHAAYLTLLAALTTARESDHANH